MPQLDDFGSEWPDEVQLALQAYPEMEADRVALKGANGFVVFGRHKLLGIRLALKIYYYDAENGHEEPRLLTSVQSAHVLRVLDARILSKEYAYFVTAEADGGDLDNVISQGLGLAQAITVCRGILEGLAALHAPPYRLLHRDIKPENIFFHENKAVIGDFGSVRLLPYANGEIPASGQSLLYKAPECITDRLCSISSDTYQVGIIGYQLLGGHLSYELESHLRPEEKKRLRAIHHDYDRSKYIDNCIGGRIQKGKLLDWNSIPETVPRVVVAVFKRATHTRPERRYGSAAAFLAALAGVPDPLPKWSRDRTGWHLAEWKGNDYRVEKTPASMTVYKARSGSGGWRRDNALSAATLPEVLQNMQRSCGLPV
jgi:serine/threonine protein kinase